MLRQTTKLGATLALPLSKGPSYRSLLSVPSSLILNRRHFSQSTTTRKAFHQKQWLNHVCTHQSTMVDSVFNCSLNSRHMTRHYSSQQQEQNNRQELSQKLYQALYCLNEGSSEYFYPDSAMLEIQNALSCIENGQFGRAFFHFHSAMIHSQNGIQISRIYNVSSHLIKHFVGSGDLLQVFHVNEWDHLGHDDISNIVNERGEVNVEQAAAMLAKYRVGIAESDGENEQVIDSGLRSLYRLFDDQSREHQKVRNIASVAVLLRGVLSRVQGSQSFAQKYYGQAMELLNDLVVAYVVRGESYIEDNMDSQGLSDLTRAVSLDAKNPLSFQRRGAILSRLNMPGAEADLQKSIELYDTDPTSYLIRGEVYASKENSFDLALADYNKAISLNNTNVEAYYERAMFLSKYEDRLADAMSDINLIHSIDNEHVQAYYLRAAIEEKQQNYYSALKSIDQVIKYDPDFPLIYEFRGRVHHDRLNNIEAAEKDFRTAISKNSVSFQTPVYLGKILSDSDAESAIQLFTQAIKLEPEDPIAYTLRAYLHLSNTEDGQAALEDYDQAIEIRKRHNMQIDPELLIYRASAYVKMEEYDTAINELENVKNMNLTQREKQLCLMHLGIAYGEKNMSEESLRYFDECIQVDPDNAGVYFSRGLIHRYNDNLQQSVEDITKAIQLKGNDFDPVYHFERGLSYLQLEDTQKAIKDFETAITLEHQFVEAYSQRANAFIQEERYREALLDLDKVIELDEEDTWALVRRAKVFIVLGQVEEAFEDFNQAIERNSEDPTFYLARAKAYAEAYQDVRKALVDVNKALMLDNHFSDAFLFRAKLYKNFLSDDKKALSDLNSAITSDADHSESYYERALILRDMGRNDEALDDLNTSINLTPDANSYAARAELLCSFKSDIEASLRDCERSLEYNSNNIEALNMKATILLLQKQQPENALQLLNQSLSAEPDQVTPYALRALIYSKHIPNTEAYNANYEELNNRVSDPEAVISSLTSTSSQEDDLAAQIAQYTKQ